MKAHNVVINISLWPLAFWCRKVIWIEEETQKNSSNLVKCQRGHLSLGHAIKKKKVETVQFNLSVLAVVGHVKYGRAEGVQAHLQDTGDSWAEE